MSFSTLTNTIMLGYSGHTSGPNGKVTRVVIHATVSPCEIGGGRANARYFQSPTSGGLAHYVVDPSEIVGCCDEMTACWHAPPNHGSLGVELTDPQTGDGARWQDSDHQKMLALAARLVADICARHSLPLVWLSPSNLLAGDCGVTSHANVSAAWHQCVSADTPILKADLTWVPAGDLIVGDDLVGFEADSVRQVGRRFERSTVTRNDLVRDTLLSVETDRGAVRCNREHPWLVRRGRNGETLTRADGSKDRQYGKWTWVKADDLREGDEAAFLTEPWKVDRSWEAGWLAGMLDGEGCLSRAYQTPRSRVDGSPGKPQSASIALSCAQRESPTADQMVAAFKAYGDACIVERRNTDGQRGPRRQTLIQVSVSRRTAVMRMLGMIRPPRFMARSDEVWVGGNLGKSTTRTRINRIEPAGIGTIASLSTSTRTYIAAGFAMHNSDHTDPGPDFPVDQFMALLAPPIAAEDDMTPGACKTSDGVFHTFAVTKDGRIFETTYSSGPDWGQPAQVFNGAAAALGKGGIAAVADGQRIDLFVIGPDDVQYHAYRETPADSWVWAALPGSYA